MNELRKDYHFKANQILDHQIQLMAFLSSRARTSICRLHSYKIWASSSDGKVINVILRQAFLKVNRDTAVESSIFLYGS